MFWESKGALMLSCTPFMGKGSIWSSCAKKKVGMLRGINRNTEKSLFDCNVINPIFVAVWLNIWVQTYIYFFFRYWTIAIF